MYASRRGTARRSKSAEVLPTAAELYEKSHLKMLAMCEWPWTWLKVSGNGAVWYITRRLVLATISLPTKHEVSSFTQDPKIWRRPKSLTMNHVTAPIWRSFAIPRLILAMAYLCTKFEGSSFTAQCYAMALFLSVRHSVWHKSVFYQNGWIWHRVSKLVKNPCMVR